jgi:ATP-dependent protease ClpP protease subunit
VEIIKPLINILEFDRNAIREKIKELDLIVAAFGPEHPIVVQIDSYGGEVAGLSMFYNKLKTLSNPIITYTSSVAASCGANLLVLGASDSKDGGPMRIASEGAEIMIHDISHGTGGDVKDMVENSRAVLKLSEYWMGKMANALKLKNRDELIDFIHQRSKGSHDIHFTAKEALDLGLIDMIGDVTLTPFQGFDVSVKTKMENLPEEVKPKVKKIVKKKKK